MKILNLKNLLVMVWLLASTAAFADGNCYLYNSAFCDTNPLSGDVRISANSGYDIVLDGSYVGLSSYNWNTRNYSNGSHRLQQCHEETTQGQCRQVWISDIEWVANLVWETHQVWVSDYIWVSDWVWIDTSYCGDYDEYGDCVSWVDDGYWEDNGYWEDDGYWTTVGEWVDEGSYQDLGYYVTRCDSDTTNYICSNNLNVNVNNTVIVNPTPTPVTGNAYSGMWWIPAESGWGMTITQHDARVFLAMYTYDSNGKPDWYTISNCTIPNGGSSCDGDIYHVTGGSALTTPWTGHNPLQTVGHGTINFSDSDHAVFTFSINGVANTKVVQKDIFRLGSTPINYTDMWWAGEAESGWGAVITHQGNVMFIAIYTYDLSGNPIWYTASECTVTGNTCAGALYKTSGGKPMTGPWSPNTFAIQTVGSINVNFSDANHATMSFTVDGNSGFKAISRLLF